MELINVMIANSVLVYNNTTALKTGKPITKSNFIKSLHQELLPVVTSYKIDPDRVFKQQQQKKVSSGQLDVRVSKDVLKKRAQSNQIRACRQLKKQRQKYHAKQDT